MRKRQLKELCRCDVRVLRNYLAPYLADARTELVGLTAEEIVDRFLGWCSRPLNVPVGEGEGGRSAGTG
ncbi:hypothetical protein [Micromonospora yangpuensis]|uniref:hypothetical protein n=1 Tax=Micromonospora yangpuensis TaxID=683228 RepID=UPI0015862899|nr:hypothetical protein [Micromonospora yangpuensis]GGL97725.1 hypothetical protein GCM10012279_13990 [Micromonospora yangpuensis]